ncbi:NADase-type glycan-binding domain-containing protein [Leptospira sp. 'Mane']|uniref:NADase-type glycan-binding domain-containing protein n=1 Tax=Leptospira sp. 'Mane' TaxID=3387407 RepID=UPI00398B9C4D
MIRSFFIIYLIVLLQITLFSEGLNPPFLSSSSILEPNKKKYLPGFAMDGKLETSWVEGAKGDGIGETLTISYKSPVLFQTLAIYNGFGDPRFWNSSNRVKKIKISTENNYEESFHLKDSLSLQKLELKKEISAKEIKLTILEIYKGTKQEDTAIAEVNLLSDNARSILIPAKNTWAIGKWKTESNVARITVHSDGTCEMGYETAKMLCTWIDKGAYVQVSLEAELPITKTDKLQLKLKQGGSNPVVEVNGKYLFIANKDEV